MTLGEEIIQGLTEACEYLRGERELRVDIVEDKSIPDVSAAEITDIRTNAGLSEFNFAAIIGVRPETVRSWENGSTKPSAPARRIISIIKKDPDFVSRYGLC